MRMGTIKAKSDKYAGTGKDSYNKSKSSNASKLTEADRIMIIDKYTLGISPRELASEYKVTIQTIYNVLKQAPQRNSNVRLNKSHREELERTQKTLASAVCDHMLEWYEQSSGQLSRILQKIHDKAEAEIEFWKPMDIILFYKEALKARNEQQLNMLKQQEIQLRKEALKTANAIMAEPLLAGFSANLKEIANSTPDLIEAIIAKTNPGMKMISAIAGVQNPVTEVLNNTVEDSIDNE